jgi:hypothetical protein
MSLVEIRRAFIRFFVSLRVTIVLLALSIVLVFWGTLAQVHIGIWGVQDKFFRSFIVLGTIPNTSIPVPLFPGGYFIGGLLLINLVVSHLYRFRFTWQKAGIQLTHFGLILLLVGELITSLFQEEFQLRLDEDLSRNYAESFRDNELVIIDITDPDWDDVVAIPEPILARGREVQHPQLPFRVVPRLHLPNANLGLKDPAAPRDFGEPDLATQGIGPQVAVAPLRVTSKEDERNLPAAYVELQAPEGPVGTWLVSPMLVQPQEFEYGGRSYRIALRFAREYKPFSLTLKELKHDVYPGSDIPKNFSSLVRLQSADGEDDFEALIYMNNPLRHRGLTFYQYQMDSVSGFSVLQVVRNPGWTIPYIACVLMALGLTLQFGRHLLTFVGRRRVTA